MAKKDNVEYRYGNIVKQCIDLIGPKHLRVVGGRGFTKTTDIHADRSMDVCYSMPRSRLVWVADTYVNARANVIPKLIEGWVEYKGWREGVHFVVDEKPPSNFDLPYSPLVTYKNTISIHNGCNFQLGSLDQMSGLAGGSYQHAFGDEVKYHDKKKLDTVLPALRGFTAFSHSPFYRGTTFTTDLPNLSKGDFDWIMDTEKNMNVEQIKIAFQCGTILNDINHKIKKAYDRRDKEAMRKLIKQRERWMVRWYKSRYDSTFFIVVSSLVNLDILTPGYIYDNLESLGWEEFKQSVLSFKSQLEEGDRFYTGLGQHHFYQDGILNDYVQSFGIKDDFEANSLMLRYIDHDAPLDCGVDFGKMISMVIGQELGPYFYALKGLFTLIPESSAELGEKFRKFFKHHRKKVLYMYYDRSGNQYESSGRDWATEVKNHIEYDKKGRTNWKVILMSKEQATIYQSQEFFFMKQVFQQTVKDLPGVKIDQYQCKELKSSMELAMIETKKDTKTGKTTIHKNKKSESLPTKKLPMQSTNFSDAFKYLMYRKKWAELVKRRSFTLPTGLDGM